MRVTNMVCVQCDQSHDREHLKGCPATMREAGSRDYNAGWLAARESYSRRAVEAAKRERTQIVRALSEVVSLLGRGR